MASARGALAAPARSPSPRRAPSPKPAAPRRAPAPEPKPKPRAARRRARGLRFASGSAIAWIVVGGALLAGVVFVNLVVLRLNLRLEQATQQRAQLHARDSALESQLSAAVASGRIQELARSQDGLVQANPSSIGYIDLGG